MQYIGMSIAQVFWALVVAGVVVYAGYEAFKMLKKKIGKKV
jgi:hypothetical protein